MLSPDLGKKRRCTACEAAFYDLNRDPITCPKCGAPHQPVTRLKSDGREPPKGRSFKRKPPPEPVPEAAAQPAEPLEEEELDPADAADEPDDADEDDDELDGQEIEAETPDEAGEERR
jgi:uncharacterized protein (TIGR02300 family)